MPTLEDLRRIASRAQTMVRDAFRQGLINQARHDQLLEELTPADERATRITITLSLANAAKLASRSDVRSQVEQALTRLAAQAGATVVAGSVAVAGLPSLTEEDPEEDTSDEYDPEDEDDEGPTEEHSSAPGQAVTITTRVTGDTSLLRYGRGSTQVEEALSRLARERLHGVRIENVSVTADGGRVTVGVRASGDLSLLDSPLAPSVIEEALRPLASANGLSVERESTTVSVG